MKFEIHSNICNICKKKKYFKIENVIRLKDICQIFHSSGNDSLQFLNLQRQVPSL